MAFLVSLFVLFTQMYVGYLNRNHYRLSVRPHLGITPFLEAGPAGRDGLYLTNEGLGPGIIKSFKVTVHGIEYAGLGPSLWFDIEKQLALEQGCFASGWPIPGSVVKSGDELTLLVLSKGLKEQDRPRCMGELVKLITADLRFQLTYESMYEESFTYIGSGKINDARAQEMGDMLRRLQQSK